MSDDRPRVLDVGQCVPDHFGIAAVLSKRFGARVDRADSVGGAFGAVKAGRYDLVLVNRVLDGTGEEGVELIRRLQGDEATRAVPVMLVSNYDDAQVEAVALGAKPGFGKASLHKPATLELLATVLEQ